MSVIFGALLRGFAGLAIDLTSVVIFVDVCTVSAVISSGLTFFGRPLFRGTGISESPYSASFVAPFNVEI